MDRQLMRHTICGASGYRLCIDDKHPFGLVIYGGKRSIEMLIVDNGVNLHSRYGYNKRRTEEEGCCCNDFVVMGMWKK